MLLNRNKHDYIVFCELEHLYLYITVLAADKICPRNMSMKYVNGCERICGFNRQEEGQIGGTYLHRNIGMAFIDMGGIHI